MGPEQGGTLKRADPSTIQDKVLVGYQGWFTCAGDGTPIHQGHHGWLHWFNSPIPSGGRPNLDLWPDTSEYDPSELFPAPGLATASGDPVYLFSSRNPKTVQRHFHWMARHGVDGAFLQRFAGQCEIKPGNLGIRDLRDEVGDRVREAAEAEGRVYAIMYDVSGISPDKIQDILEQDWAHLLRDKHLLDSPSYLREKGRPVVALWGFGFNGRNHTPELLRAITGFFRSFTPGGVYLVAGAPGHWRTSTSDADRNPEFVQVWTECFDAISPWTVGRYGNEEDADRWGQGRLKEDAEYLNKLASEGGRKVDYIPVVLPGGSGFNLSKGKWRMNDMRRNGGQFLWTQIYNARRAGVRTIYGAMWDEYDEGTVYMPVVPHASQLPVHSSFRFLALDVDGQDLPSDWYMRVLGYAAEGFHRERTLPEALPVGELQDYWRTRPHYEALAVAGRGTRNEKQADVDGVTRAFGAWGVSEGNVNANMFPDAPPPYSLEDASAPQGVLQHRPSMSTSTQAPTHPPPVRQNMRPGHAGSLLAGAAGAAAAAGIVAHTLAGGSGGATSSSSSASAAPPRVNMASRPVPPAGQPSRASSEIRTGAAPPVALRTGSPPTHAGRPSIGHGGATYAPPAGPPPPPMGDEHGRGRQWGRTRSESRSRSRSSSRSRRHGAMPPAPMYPSMHGPGLGHTHSVGPGPDVRAHPHPHSSYASVGPHGHSHHGHGHLHHSQSLSPVGSPQGMAFPGAGSGAYDVYAGGGGGYVPVHSHPLGQGGPGYVQGQGQGPHGAYGGPYPPQGGFGYGLGPGPGQGYDAMGSPPQQQGYGPGPGYAPPPPPGFYPSYVPNSEPGPSMASYPASPTSAGGGGKLQGGINSALNAVEGFAGPNTRRQLEKTVKSLSHTGSTLLNKLK